MANKAHETIASPAKIIFNNAGTFSFLTVSAKEIPLTKPIRGHTHQNITIKFIKFSIIIFFLHHVQTKLTGLLSLSYSL